MPEPLDDYESKEVCANIILSNHIKYQKHLLSKCLQDSMCKTCKESHECNYVHYSMEGLIYWKVRELVETANMDKLEKMKC